MARISLGLCMMFVVASSVIYEAQGTFLLKLYLKNEFPNKCSEFTPFANKGMLTLVSDLEDGCPATAEFKNFFTSFKGYMSFIDSASATSKNVDVEMTTKADELLKAMSALSGGQSGKSADAGNFKVTIISMGKTLVEQKKSTKMMTIAEKKKLVTAMVKWTKMVATFVKTASEKKGKTIDIKSYGLDVNVNDASIVGSSTSTEKTSTKSKSSTLTKTETESSASKETVSTKKKQTSGGKNGSTFKDTTGSASPSGSPTGSPSGKTSLKGSGSVYKTKESSRGSAASTKTGSTFKDTTGSASPSGSPTGSPSSKTTGKQSGNASSMKKETNTENAKKKTGGSVINSSSKTSVKQVESETSKEVMTFIMDLEKKYSGKAELKAFFEKLKASMTASATVSSNSAKDYVSRTRLETDKLSEVMALVGSRYSKSAKMKSNMETCQDKLMKTLKELQDINSKIVNEKTVTATQQTEIKQTITKWEQVTTQYVETAASSSSSSSSQQSSGMVVKKN